MAARAAGQTDYAGSKFAAVGFTEALRAELRQQDSGVTTLLVAPFYIATGMFQGVTPRFPRLLPILDPDDVATRVLDAIESGREQLIMPLMASLVPAGRILPVRLFDRAMDFYGVNRSMAGVTGRGARPYRDLPA
ncbi:SDR family NAD(P)-dependent oxidoreductase [Brachybacterium aquaticum]|uniref:Short-subunit dehydrogenase n=1 Tax=Brachybacterium aquaticum TaxID=1432564 RepID=A0A841AC61_9MICO|nr:SDR family NAD(P)-dependent oxidoreductase [Brachybacterium aquaticum]MBB5831211.1 short-subunit dehydrogenase [Brachybacterium aquaticum]